MSSPSKRKSAYNDSLQSTIISAIESSEPTKRLGKFHLSHNLEAMKFSCEGQEPLVGIETHNPDHRDRMCEILDKNSKYIGRLSAVAENILEPKGLLDFVEIDVDDGGFLIVKLKVPDKSGNKKQKEEKATLKEFYSWFGLQLENLEKQKELVHNFFSTEPGPMHAQNNIFAAIDTLAAENIPEIRVIQFLQEIRNRLKLPPFTSFDNLLKEASPLILFRPCTAKIDFWLLQKAIYNVAHLAGKEKSEVIQSFLRYFRFKHAGEMKFVAKEEANWGSGSFLLHISFVTNPDIEIVYKRNSSKEVQNDLTNLRQNQTDHMAFHWVQGIVKSNLSKDLWFEWSQEKKEVVANDGEFSLALRDHYPLSYSIQPSWDRRDLFVCEQAWACHKDAFLLARFFSNELNQGPRFCEVFFPMISARQSLF